MNPEDAILKPLSTTKAGNKRRKKKTKQNEGSIRRRITTITTNQKLQIWGRRERMGAWREDGLRGGGIDKYFCN